MGECLKKGYLLKCPQKARAFKKWNSRWFVLYGNSPRGRVRLEYYDNEKAWQQERGKRIIPLVHCVSIKPVWNKDYNHVLEIVTSDKTFYLGAGNKDEEKAWFKSLCKIVFGNANRNSIVHVLDRPDPIDMGYHSLDRGTDGESNLSRSNTLAKSSPQLTKVMGSREKLGLDSTGNSDLNVTTSSTDTISRNATSSLSCELSSLISFESGFDDAASTVSSVSEAVSRYHVTVRPTIASQEAGMSGQYILQISPTILTLLDISTENLIAEWQIQHLRRYGRGRTKFSFEAGDKCKSGIGVYTFNTGEGDQIFHLVDMHARKLSSLQKKDHKEKRISLPAESFRPLNETRRRAKSEGKLLESSDDSTINETSESLELISTNSKPISTTVSSFPSKARTCTLDVIKDQESGDKQLLADGSVRPRSHTDAPSEKEQMRHVIESHDGNVTCESTESLLQNPASADLFAASLETLKAQSVELNCIMKPKSNKEERSANSNVQTDIAVATEHDTERNIIDATDGKAQRFECQENQSNEERPESRSPFEPLSTSEQASIDNKVTETREFDEVATEETDGPNQILADETSVLQNVHTKSNELEGTKSAETKKEDPPKKRKTKRFAQRNKSFEFGSLSEKAYDNRKQSGSFSSFDFRKYRDANEPVYKAENGSKKLQRFASVKKTVEMYEKLSTAACDARQKSFTLWKRKSFKSSQKPEVSKRTNETNS